MIPGKQFKPEDIIALAKRYKWLVILPFVFGSLIALIVSQTLPDKFRSDTLILVVPQRVPESYVQSTVTTRIEDRLQSITQQIMSRTRLERIITDLNLYQDERRTGIMQDIVEAMRGDINVQTVRGDAFRVSFAYNNARTAQQVTERLAGLFIDENLRDRRVLAEGTNQFLESQLEEARQKLQAHEKRLEDYRRAHSGSLPQQFESNLQVIQNTQMQVQALIESINRDRDRKLILERMLADTQAEAQAAASAVTTAVASGDPQALAGATYAQQLEAARTQLQSMLLRLKPEHPDVQRMNRVIKGLEAKAAQEALEAPVSGGPIAARPKSPAEALRENKIRDLRAEMESLDRQITAKQREEARLRGVIAEYQGRVETTPTRESELTNLMRDYDTLRGIYTSLLGKYENSRVAANLEERQIGEQFRVLDPANLPPRPFSPNRPMINAAGAVIGLGLGVGLVALLVFRDQSLRTEADVVMTLSLPVLAMIPVMSTATERRRDRRRRLLLSSAAVAATLVLGATALALKLDVWGAIRWRLGIN
jgi:polysaccharide chain length determinant protein (PEP-CTERM system associated)